MTEADRRISVAFQLIADYALKQGWVPVGHRTFTVGDWSIRINGTPLEINGLEPYHALIENERIVAMMVISPFGGTVGGYQMTEDMFIDDMKKAVGS